MKHVEPVDPSLGRIEIAPDHAWAGQPGTWRITYHCGARALDEGARLHLCPPFTFDNRHNSCVRWEYGTVTAECHADAELTTAVVDRLNGQWGKRYHCNVIEITIAKGRLTGGDSVTIVLGDQRDGGDPAVAQWLSGPDMPFIAAVAMPGAEEFVALPLPAMVEVLGERAERLICVAPSTPPPAEPFALRLRAEDALTNVSALYDGVPAFDLPGSMTGPAKVALRPHDHGRKIVNGFRVSEPGIRRVRLSDGPFASVSNPICPDFTEGGGNIYWGEIHAHTELGDGVGSEDRYYEFARDEAFLDFAAIGEHGGGDLWWPACLEAAARHNDPGRFVTLAGYEWRWKGAGHANVYGPDLTLPVHGNDEREALFNLVRAGQAVIIPHHTNDPLIMGGGRENEKRRVFGWDQFDPELIRVAEICQMRGSFEFEEPGGHVLFGGWGSSIQSALAKGFRIGFTGGTDNHSGRPGSPMRVAFRGGRMTGSATECDLQRTYLDRTLCGLTAVMAPELTRVEVFRAIHERRCYATTGARILLHVALNDLRMGEEGAASANARLRVKVAGTDRIESVVIVKTNEEAHTVNPESEDADFTWEDPDPGPGNWYYVRVTQADGHLAWSSPIWTD